MNRAETPSHKGCESGALIFLDPKHQDLQRATGRQQEDLQGATGRLEEDTGSAAVTRRPRERWLEPSRAKAVPWEKMTCWFAGTVFAVKWEQRGSQVESQWGGGWRAVGWRLWEERSGAPEAAPYPAWAAWNSCRSPVGKGELPLCVSVPS